MTKPDKSADLSKDPRDFTDLKRAAIASIGGLVLVFLLAVLAGYTDRTLEEQIPDTYDAIVIGTLVILIGLIAWAMWALWPSRRDDPEAPRVKRSRNIVYGLMGISVFLGLLLAVADGPGTSFFSGGPINPLTAGIAIFFWLGLMPIATWLWWSSIDEHEGEAYRDGAFVAGHAYLFIVPAWWLGTKAGWLPPQEPISIMLIISVIWSLVWLIRKYL